MIGLCDYMQCFNVTLQKLVLAMCKVLHKSYDHWCLFVFSDYLLERAEDYLTADDPALFSDEFSEPEEWGI